MTVYINSISSSPDLTGILNVFIFIFGLCFGSFLNVCIYRFPRKESVMFGASHCTNCGCRIRFYENIPLISWLLLRGKCSKCRSKISVTYPLIELITGVLVYFLWLEAKGTPYPIQQFLMYLNLTFLLIPTFFIDLKYHLIPNRLTFTALYISIALVLLFPQLTNCDGIINAFTNSFLGFTVSVSILLIFAFLGKLVSKKDIIGWGDIKFIGVLGAAFGYYSYSWLAILLISSWLGAIFGLILIIFRKKRWTEAIPFGPFLVIGTYIWIFFGQNQIIFYRELLYKILL
ncbi:MAG: prepilin peptidase [Victivallales bacterium]|nr:prepilin peptidase [Victivallales bacterium]